MARCFEKLILCLIYFFSDSTSLQERAVLEEELKQLVEIGKHPNIVGLIGYGIRDGNSLFALPFTRAKCELFVGNLELSSRTKSPP